MRKLTWPVVVITLLGLVSAPAAAGSANAGPRPPSAYTLPGDRAFPTGMAFDRATGYFYVGSADDGTLFRGHVSRPRLEVWSPDGEDGRSVTSGMALDAAGRLYVGGADTGTMRVYDTRSRRLLATLRGLEGGFLNEITVAGDGTVYATDSFRPVLYRITGDGGRWRIENWLDVAATPIDWVEGRHNLNGILAVGRHLLTVNSSTGDLWRIDRHSGAAVQVDLDGHGLPNGDGLAWRDGRLHVVQGNINQVPGLVPQVAVVEMSSDLARGGYTARYVPPGGFRHPSSIALTGTRVMVVNSQYDRWVAGLPPETLPFTVSSLDIGAAEPVSGG
ncbi:SMP-30/gluconolactonase/LRE family protein [Actinomadura sp. 9N407]|uniref:SMP-30/gluconolactonase/LRE family protein n=1 Tax=Actinomadura sp. 9N407 TaxID=3375154 RepID=UPI00378AB4DF